MRAVVVVACLVALPAFAQSAEDEAGDVSELDKDAVGPLRSRIRPVSGQVWLQRGRFELSPMVGASFRDAFFTKVLFGAALTYHITESVALSARGAYTLSLISGSAQICNPPGADNGQPAGCRAPTFQELTTSNDQPSNKAYGLLTFVAGLDLLWAPLYGKLSLFAEQVVNFNMYLAIGPTVVMYGPTRQVTVGGNVGVGFRFFLSSWVALRIELRDTIYNEFGEDPGGQVSSIRNQLTAELGLSMFFPTTFKGR